MKGVRKLWRRGRGLVRLARHIQGFLAEPISPAQAASSITDGVRGREARFLKKIEHSVYGNPRSPYRRLLEACGCQYGDVRGVVQKEGLDAALTKLAAAGVRLTFEEFKCRTPAKRGSRTFHFEPEDFADPTFRAENIAQTGGSSGKPMRFGWGFALTQQWAPHWCTFFAAHGAIGDPLILWSPGNSGSIGPQLAWAKFQQRVDYWFVSQEMTRFADRAYTEVKHWICRQWAGFPHRRDVAYHETEPVLECGLEILRNAERVTINTTPSAAVRLSRAAQDRGADFSRVRFFLGAEPLTTARRTTIEASGARAIPLYGSTEAVWTGGQCPFPARPDEVHVLRDLHAVIPGPRDEHEPDTAPLLFTSLAPFTPIITLNTDIGDRGVIEYRNCDCLYDQMGCRQTIHTIRSSDKLTEFGVTIWAADVQDVLEEVLQRRFRTAPGDFQLVETQTSDGLPVYLLLVDPRVGEIEERTLAKLFLDELGRRKPHYSFMTAIWEREQVLQVRRHSPLVTSRGKVPSFYRVRDLALLPDTLKVSK